MGISYLNTDAQSFQTESFSEKIRTLLVHSTEGWDVPPVISLNGNNQIEISFDQLGATPGYFTYSIIHCNADWKPSILLPYEYMDGLQNNYLDDYANSFNTHMDYVNFKLFLPNNDIQFKASGNYVVQIFSQENPEEPVLNACFSLVESGAEVQMKVSSITDKGVNTKFQQVSFDLKYGNEIKMPLQDLRVFVQQNNRLDNEAAYVKPLSIQNGKAIYDHHPSLIFDAGNEYRAFEMTTTRYNGLNIETVEYHPPYFHTILHPDPIRNNRLYSYSEDLNGRIFIRNLDASDSDYEADYQFVHFYVPCEKPFLEEVYILSEAFNNILDYRSKMTYSLEEGGYVKSVLLKEGYYNYLYVTRKNNVSSANSSLIEGNFYETENEYSVWVYFRPSGARYDRLIGYQTLKYN